MSTAGIRDLRDHLSSYLDVVRGGEVVTVTDRGTPVARIVPLGGTSFDRLVASGTISVPTDPDRSLPPRVDAMGTVSDLVVEQRR